MTNIWFITDTHINHAKIIEFTDDAGKIIRVNFKTGERFNSVQEHDEMFFDEIRNNIKPGDKVYHCGDVVMGPQSEYNRILSRMTAVGRWRLLPGNHDENIQITPDYQRYFEKIMSWRIFKDYGFTACHIPLHPDCFRHKTIVNVHGHIHGNVINDERFFNICPEARRTMAPIHLDEIRDYVKRVA